MNCNCSVLRILKHSGFPWTISNITLSISSSHAHIHTVKHKHTQTDTHTLWHTHTVTQTHTHDDKHTQRYTHTQWRTHTWWHTNTHTRWHTHTHTVTHTHTWWHTHTHGDTQTHTHTQWHTHTHGDTHTHMVTHTHTRWHTNTHTHSDTHTRRGTLRRMSVHVHAHWPQTIGNLGWHFWSYLRTTCSLTSGLEQQPDLSNLEMLKTMSEHVMWSLNTDASRGRIPVDRNSPRSEEASDKFRRPPVSWGKRRKVHTCLSKQHNLWRKKLFWTVPCNVQCTWMM